MMNKIEIGTAPNNFNKGRLRINRNKKAHEFN